MSRPNERGDVGNDKVSWRQRFLAGEIRPQQLVLQIGALATAVLAIAALVAAVVHFVGNDDDGGVGPATEHEQRIENQSADADELVHLLDDRNGTTIDLNHKVIGELPGANDVLLQYDCDAPAGCSVVKLALPDSTPNLLPDGIWFKRCYLVDRIGAGYGSSGLAFALFDRGATCAD
ncbi:MAG: hypothetical protein H0U21_07715 [Acidimicrobiia bacterium]|nr:hypothetical protein [Acidimicrobiia bacterium]